MTRPSAAAATGEQLCSSVACRTRDEALRVLIETPPEADKTRVKSAISLVALVAWLKKAVWYADLECLE